MDKLLYYRNWSSTILRWWMDRLCVEMEDDENSQQIKTEIQRMANEVEEAYVSRNRKTLERYYSSMSDMVIDFHPSSKKALNARLRAACGEDLTKYDKKLANSVQRIVKRGKIRNGNEYEKVRTYIDSIEGEPEHEALLQDLYRMTGDFESAVGDDPSLIGEEWK